MNHITCDIQLELTSRGIEYRSLDGVVVKSLERDMRKTFCDQHKAGDPLWEAVSNPESYHHAAGDEFADAFFRHREEKVYILIDDWDGLSGLFVENASGLYTSIKAMYSFRWYVSDIALTYLICKNDHDFVIYSTAD